MSEWILDIIIVAAGALVLAFCWSYLPRTRPKPQERRTQAPDRISQIRAEAHRRHPVVHRWPNDGGLGGAA